MMLFCVLTFQFIIIATALSFTKPKYNNIETTVTGEVVGWMMTSAPLIVMVICAIHEVVKRGPLTKHNILNLVYIILVSKCAF